MNDALHTRQWRAVWRRAWVIGMGLTCLAAQATAQTTRRPYRGLFQGGMGASEQSLVLRGSTGGGYDDNIFADSTSGLGSSSDPRVSHSGGYAQAGFELAYSLDRRRVGFGITGGSSLRYYPSLTQPYAPSHGVAVRGSARIRETTTVSALQSVTFQPYYVLYLFDRVTLVPSATDVSTGEAPEGPALQTVATSPDLAIKRRDSLVAATSVALTQTISPRTAFTASYGFYQYRTDRDSVFSSQAIGVRLSRTVTKNAGIHAAYTYTDGSYGERADQRLVRGNNVDVGVDYKRPLSRSRRTTVSFSSGTVMLDDRGARYYSVTGAAGLDREIGRTWSAGIRYFRGVNFVEAFTDPIRSDMVTARVAGLVSQRAQFRAAAVYSSGAVGFVRDAPSFDFSNATAGLTYGITRYIALSAEYVIYHYVFDPEVVNPFGLPRQLTRNGVRVQLTTWLPLFERGRRPDASR